MPRSLEPRVLGPGPEGFPPVRRRGRLGEKRGSCRRALAWTLGLDAAILILLLAVAWLTPMRLSDFTRDPVAVARDVPYAPYMGLLSNLGAILWAATVTLCLFTWARARAFGASSLAWFYLASAAVTLTWLVDDLLLLHEATNEYYVYVLYVVLLLIYLVHFRRYLLTRDPSLLVFALLAFSLSVIVDVRLVAVPESWRHLLEDGPKFLGISVWCLLFSRACWRDVSPAFPQPAFERSEAPPLEAV